jgi:hypothetical protein
MQHSSHGIYVPTRIHMRFHRHIISERASAAAFSTSFPAIILPPYLRSVAPSPYCGTLLSSQHLRHVASSIPPTTTVHCFSTTRLTKHQSVAPSSCIPPMVSCSIIAQYNHTVGGCVVLGAEQCSTEMFLSAVCLAVYRQSVGTLGLWCDC